MNDSEKLQRIEAIMAAELEAQTLLTPMQSLELIKRMQEAIGDLTFGVIVPASTTGFNDGGCSPGWPQDFYEPALEITIKDEFVKTVDLARWVRNAMPHYTTSGSLMVAKALLNGETWRPPFDEFKIDVRNPWCLIKVLNERGYKTERFI